VTGSTPFQFSIVDTSSSSSTFQWPNGLFWSRAVSE